MWKMLQQEEAQDYILATGRTASVREFTELAFKEFDVTIKWRGAGVNEVGLDAKTDKVIIKIDKNYYRPTDVNVLRGDFSKASKLLNWRPKTNLEQLVKLMVKSDLKNIKKRSDIDKNNKIFVAGHNGLVGSNIVSLLKKMVI